MTSDAFPGQGTPEQRMTTLESQKFSHLQIAKLTNGKAEFVTAVSIEDINMKGVKPAGQKKLKEFDVAGYSYNPAMSSAREWVFTREAQE